MAGSARLALAMVVAMAIVLFGAAGSQSGSPAGGKANKALVERGETLVRVGACNDCHTPMKFDEKAGMPVPDQTRYLSGHPQGAPAPHGTLGPQDALLVGPTFTSFRTPLGTAYAANLTPHPTGLGTWTEADFLRTMRSGKHMGDGRPIMPPMPWPSYGALSDADLKAMFAYLRSIPPVANEVAPPLAAKEQVDKLQRLNDLIKPDKSAH